MILTLFKQTMTWQIIYFGFYFVFSFELRFLLTDLVNLPIVTSLHDPNIIYINEPINAEYKPYCGSKPATTPYAIPWGIMVRPTVKPAIKSDIRKFGSYLGNHDRMGNFVFIEQQSLAATLRAEPTLGNFSLYRFPVIQKNGYLNYKFISKREKEI